MVLAFDIYFTHGARTIFTCVREQDRPRGLDQSKGKEISFKIFGFH